MALPVAAVALLAPLGLGGLPSTAAAGDDLGFCVNTWTGTYCIKTIPVERLAYIKGANQTETTLATVDVERWFVSLNQNIHPINPAPGVIVVAATLNGEPDPEDAEVSVTVGPYQVWTDAVFQKRLCRTQPCVVVDEPEVGNWGELWLSILEVSENGMPLVRVPITTVVLYPPFAGDFAAVGDPDLNDFTS